jgi:tetratricopeptide (TPR) repeat protein
MGFNEEYMEHLMQIALMQRMKMLDSSKRMIPNIFDSSILLATAMEQDDEWECALNVYRDLFTKIMEQRATPPQQRMIMMGLCRCLYELEMYENAVDIGLDMLDMNRHFPGIHKYLALSVKACDELDSAIDIMNRAVLYETPWDDKNKMEAMKLYNQLKSLKGKGPCDN